MNRPTIFYAADSGGASGGAVMNALDNLGKTPADSHGGNQPFNPEALKEIMTRLAREEELRYHG